MASRTQLILIARPDCHPTAVSRAVRDDMRKRGESILSERPITKAEVKRDRVHIYADDVYFEHRAFEDWKAKAHGRTFKAKVLWFNLAQGCGSVWIEELGESLPIWACAIAGKKTWFPETACVFYMEGETVEVRLDVSIAKTFVIGLTQGYVDNEKWERLDQTKLAFRCDESGEALNGLFG